MWPYLNPALFSANITVLSGKLQCTLQRTFKRRPRKFCRRWAAVAVATAPCGDGANTRLLLCLVGWSVYACTIVTLLARSTASKDLSAKQGAQGEVRLAVSHTLTHFLQLHNAPRRCFVGECMCMKLA